VLSQFGQFDAAIAHGETAVRITEAADHSVALYFTSFDLGRVHLRRGNLADATRILSRRLDLCQERQISVGGRQFERRLSDGGPTSAHGAKRLSVGLDQHRLPRLAAIFPPRVESRQALSVCALAPMAERP
jgi:hypothetical protein